MEIVKRPYEYNFTGNSIVYELLDNDAIADSSMSFQVKVILRRLDEGLEREIATCTLAPFNGRAKIDISSLIHPELQHYLPPVNNGSQHFSSGIAGCQFYIHYRLISTASPDTSWNTTEDNFLRWGFKGGVQQFRYRGNAFFTQYITNQKPFFTWQIRNRLAALNERIYLCWLNLLNFFYSDSNILLKIKIYYTDQSTADAEFVINGMYKGYMYYIPVGATELNLQAITPAQKIWYWQCWLEDTISGGLGILTEKFILAADGRNDYNQLTIHYRNSLGGIDSVRVRGVIQKNLDYQATVTERSTDPDFGEADILQPLQRTEPATEFLRYKADIGYLAKEEQDRLRDALLNREAWMIRHGRWLPLNIVTGGFELNRSNSMTWNMPIEFEIADSGNEYYTPESVDLGNASPSSNTCSSSIILSLGGIVVAGSNSTVTFNYAVSGTGSGLRWRIPGYVDAWQDIPFASSGSIPYTVATGVQIQLQMQVVCSPGNYGPVASFAIDTEVVGSTNSTIYNETSIGSTFIIRVNGTQVNTGNVSAGSYAGFSFSPVTGADIELELDGVNPAQVDLVIGGITYLGAVAGNFITWINKTTTSAGITLIVRDEPTN